MNISIPHFLPQFTTVYHYITKKSPKSKENDLKKSKKKQLDKQVDKNFGIMNEVCKLYEDNDGRFRYRVQVKSLDKSSLYLDFDSLL